METGDVTALSVAWRRGDEQALERPLPLVYRELHRVASAASARDTPSSRRHRSTRRTCDWLGELNRLVPVK